MNRQPLRYLITVAVLVLAGAVASACGPAPVSPLPGDPAATPSSSASSGPTQARASNGPTQAQQPTPTSSSLPAACLGAVVYDIDGADSADIPKSLCMKTGGVLQVRNVAPNAVAGTPPAAVSCTWEAGITNCRFILVGNATVTVGTAGRTRSIAVVVVK